MTDWEALVEPVALALLGEPQSRTSTEWRYGRKGSLAVHVAGDRRGTWYDYEAGVGGGVRALVEHVEVLDRAEALAWLRERGLLPVGVGPSGRVGPGARQTSSSHRRAGPRVSEQGLPPENRSTGRTGPGFPPDDPSERRKVAEGYWLRSTAIPASPEHPARRWLARRHLWRPQLELPPAVRWLPAHRGPAAGALVAAFWPPGEGQLTGVQLVHVDAAGLPAPDRPGPEGLTKRSHGSLAGAICVLGLPAGAPGINVAEGLADALALAARLPWPAVCMGGTAGYRNQALAAWLAGFGAVHVWPDTDGPGLEAARALAREVRRLGGNPSIKKVTRGADPGAAGAPLAEIHGEAWREYAAHLQRDGLPGWEAGRVASVMLAGRV